MTVFETMVWQIAKQDGASHRERGHANASAFLQWRTDKEEDEAQERRLAEYDAETDRLLAIELAEEITRDDRIERHLNPEIKALLQAAIGKGELK
jgi:hypothetical protein